MGDWLLYGAYGYTGRLLAAEARRRGHRPVLGGRNEAKLATMGREMGLSWCAFGLDKPRESVDIVAEYDLVFHAAGPFVQTAKPMIESCLAGKTHYLDITGELSVLEATLGYDAHAREQNVVLVSGVGFDIVPTDCLGAYVAGQLPDATQLEIAIKALTAASAGTINSMVEMLATLPSDKGSMVRQDGRLVPQALWEGSKQVAFSDGKQYKVYPIPWGDLATAEISTGIPTITTYMALPVSPQLARMAPWAGKVLQVGLLREVTKAVVNRTVSGPDEKMRDQARSFVWARASNDHGQSVEAWLETVEAYRFTGEAGVRCVEHVLAERPCGALTPSQAFGADFVLEIPGSKRFDSLQ